ncbi:hypothetical protein MUG91_G10n216 [Manis pentadactyla]|nr:hypothetical protein MUG91_G10n216 [Manis pentadactyla]
MLAPEEEDESSSNWSIQGGKEDLCVLAKALNGPALLKEKKKESEGLGSYGCVVWNCFSNCDWRYRLFSCTSPHQCTANGLYPVL